MSYKMLFHSFQQDYLSMTKYRTEQHQQRKVKLVKNKYFEKKFNNFLMQQKKSAQNKFKILL